MAITSAVGAYSAGAASSSGSSANQKADKTELTMDDFFTLLAAQLSNQNALDPVDNTEFIAQMAQFSTLTQMQKLSVSSQMTYAVSLIGKNVDVKALGANGTSAMVSGTVDKVSVNDGAAYVEISGISYPATDVLTVR